MPGHSFENVKVVWGGSTLYGGFLVPFIAQFVVGRDGISKDEANAWESEQRPLAQRSEFFFACIQFCFTATRPG